MATEQSIISENAQAVVNDGTTPSPIAAQNQYHLRMANFSDVPLIARVWATAFFDDQVIGKLMHPHRDQYPEDVYWFLLRGIRERFWDWRHQFVVVTVQDGGKERVAGAADWRRVGKGGEKRELWTIDPRNAIKPLLHAYHSLSLLIFPNRAADPSRSSFLEDAVANSEKHWTGERAECWDLHVCGVHPDFQGKGIGKLLAQWGVHEAQREGDDVVASVICGEKNRGFYGKAGMGVQVSKGDSGIVLFSK